MLKQRSRTLTGAVILIETLVWLLAFFAAYQTRAHVSYFDRFGGMEPWNYYVMPALISSAVWALYVGVSGVVGPGLRLRPAWDEISNVVGGVAAVVASTFAVVFLLKVQSSSRLMVGFYTAYGVLGIIAVRIVVRRLMRTGYTDILGRNVAIVGEGDVARRVADAVLAHSEWGLRVAGFIGIDADAVNGPSLGSLANIGRIVEQQVVDEVIFAGSNLDLQQFEHALAVCDEAGVNTRIVLDFFPHKVSSISLDDLDGFPTLAFHTTNNDAFPLAVKRVFDIAVASAALILGAPVFIAVALAIKITMPGPVIFVQRRVGLNGREFDFYKFRSMVVDAAKLEAQLRAHNDTQGPTFKMQNDPRVTPFGHFLRKTSLDEIPQFFNVLRGEMSIVGPRPLALEHSKAYERWQRRRLSVKPGLTCIWQVSGRSNIDFDTWMRLDLQYIDNWSLWLDLRLFVLTIPAVLLARGAR